MRKLASILLKIIGYLAFFCGVIGSINLIIHGMFDPIFSTLALIVFIFIGTLCLTLGKRLQKSKGSLTEVEIAVEKKPKDVATYKIQWNKIGLSILIVGICTTIWGCIIGLNYDYNAIFYVPFYLIVMSWYLYLLWRKAPATSEDYLLLPLLQKIGLFKSYTNNYELRNAVLKTFVPVYIGTFAISAIVVILNDILCPGGYHSEYPDDISIGSFILFIPIMAWIIFLTYSYGSQWVSKVKENDKQK